MHRAHSPDGYGDGELDEDEEITAGRPLDIISEELFTDHTDRRRGRRTNQSPMTAMLRSLNQLEAVVSVFSEPEEETGTAAPTIDPILSELMTENTVRQWVGPHNYLAGLQYYMEARVLERRVWRNTLSGKVYVHRRERLQLLRDGKTEEYSVWIRVRNGVVPRDRIASQIDLRCDCFKGGENNEPCGHIASLLIAWSRKPVRFENVEISDPAGTEEIDDTGHHLVKKNAQIEKVTQSVLTRLQEVLQLVEEPSCSRKELLALLEIVYSRIKLASANLHERMAEASQLDGDERHYWLEALLGFSLLLSTASTRLLSCLERKFEVGVLTDLLTDASREMTGRMLDGLANTDDSVQARETGGMTGPAEAEDGRTAHGGPFTREPPNQVPATAPANSPGVGGGSSGIVSRSWDGVLEKFAHD